MVGGGRKHLKHLGPFQERQESNEQLCALKRLPFPFLFGTSSKKKERCWARGAPAMGRINTVCVQKVQLFRRLAIQLFQPQRQGLEAPLEAQAGQRFGVTQEETNVGVTNEECAFWEPKMVALWLLGFFGVAEAENGWWLMCGLFRYHGQLLINPVRLCCFCVLASMLRYLPR